MKLFLFYTVSLSYHGTEEGTVVIVAAPNSPTQEGGGVPWEVGPGQEDQ